jgi:hypothetical protein
VFDIVASHDKPNAMRYAYQGRFNSRKGKRYTWEIGLAKTMVHPIFPFVEFIEPCAKNYHANSMFIMCPTTS